MRRLGFIGLLLTLALAAPAQAKEVLSATVCGANGCATSHDRDLIAGLAEGGDPVDPPKAAAPFFRVRLAMGEGNGKVVERFWMRFMPRGELIRGGDGTWMPATDAFTTALKQVVDPGMQALPASRLAKLLAVDRPVPVPRVRVSEVVEFSPSPAAADGGGLAAPTIGLAAGGALAIASLVVLGLRRRRQVAARPSAA